jgi:hypothetical protein
VKMKALQLLILFIILTSCVQENKNTTGIANSVSDSLKISDLKELPIVRNTNEISVVNPVIPGRTLTVGGEKADIQGFNSAAIQTAIDALHQTSNGGTIRLLPGTFDIIAPVKLYSNMTLSGSGAKTVLKKCEGFRSKFALDADYGELQIKVADASGFREGMAVAVYDDDQRTGWALTTARITGIKENTIYIDDYLLRDYQSDKNGTISNSCSVIEAVGAENVRIADLIVDGSKTSNDMIDGCRAGGIYLHKVRNALVENVTVKDFNCDGISWQITEYVTVRNCEVYGCANSGLHPGTGSPFTLIEGNNSYNNDGYGLFVCWRVRNGIVRNNNFHDNGVNGICTGHKDTDMLFSENRIFENGSDGVHLRGETDLNAPHRSIFKNNLIENNGTRDKGYGLSVNCHAEGVVLENNTIRNTGAGKQQAAVLLTTNSLPLDLKNNKISGHPEVEMGK